MATKKADVKRQVIDAAGAAEEKKAENLAILELDKSAGGFTDYFVICSGNNPRQIQAISDEVELRLSKAGLRPTHVEGYKQAEWVLLDYVDFVVHVFSQKARQFYNLERLWKSAKQLSPAEMRGTARKRARATATKSTAVKRRSPVSRSRTRKG